LVQILLREYVIERWFIFPPHLPRCVQIKLKNWPASYRRLEARQRVINVGNTDNPGVHTPVTSYRAIFVQLRPADHVSSCRPTAGRFCRHGQHAGYCAQRSPESHANYIWNNRLVTARYNGIRQLVVREASFERLCDTLTALSTLQTHMPLALETVGQAGQWHPHLHHHITWRRQKQASKGVFI